MGLVNFLLDMKGQLSNSAGDRDVAFGPSGIPEHLEKFAKEAFGSGMCWPPVHYRPDRSYFDAAGYTLPVPNPNATHP